MEVRPLDGEAGHPGGRDHAAFGTFVFGAFAVPLRPAAGLVAAIGSTRTPWPVKGLAGQFWRTNETRQGSILFRLLAGGEGCTSIDRPRSSARGWNSRCHARAVAATPRP